MTHARNRRRRLIRRGMWHPGLDQTGQGAVILVGPTYGRPITVGDLGKWSALRGIRDVRFSRDGDAT